jgi:tRNA(adenine34) deaminase
MQKIVDDPNSLKELDEKWMREAIVQARLALAAGEVPVGAVIVYKGALLSSAYNNPIFLHDPSAHAEILAIRKASIILKNYRLAGATLYVTLEPCLMCAGAMIQARIARLVFGASDPKNGAAQSLYHIFDDRRLNHRVLVQGGILVTECGEILSGFFREKRLFVKT